MKLLKTFTKKFTESITSVLPVFLIVLVLSLTPAASLTPRELSVFCISSAFLVLGITLFGLGADIAMTPMGKHIGAGLTKTKSLVLLLSVCFVMGLFITVAEPDLSVLAAQTSDFIDSTLLICAVGVGVGLFFMLAVIKIVFSKPLSPILFFFYMVMFAVSGLIVIGGGEGFMALAFDSGGVTTGPITVPFIMALCAGIAGTLGGKNSAENSFGGVAMCSVGPVLAVLMLGLFSKGTLSYTLPDYSVKTAFLGTVLSVAKEVGLSLALIALFFVILQVFCLRLPRQTLVRIGVGFALTFAGLVIFLSAASVGYMPIGFKLGQSLASNGPALLITVGVVLGAGVLMAEPAVAVLTRQVEEITDGAVSGRSVFIAMSAGAGIALGLSMLRIVLGFNVLYYLVPMYILSLGLSFFVPGIYTAIAFDSGGVASGPLTSSFVLPLAIGACCALQGADTVMTNAFGVVAMVAAAPLITIQLLGFKAVLSLRLSHKAALKQILAADDGQIISFM